LRYPGFRTVNETPVVMVVARLPERTDMRSAVASVMSFAATCLYAPALADELAVMVAPGLVGLASYLGARSLTWIAHNLQSEEAPRKRLRSPCPPKTTSSRP
jgi:hypothetical protein